MKKIKMTLWTGLAMLGAFFAFPAEKEISVNLLSRMKKVIPIYYQHNGFWVSNVKLPAIVIGNHSAGNAAIGTIAIVGKSAGKELVRNTVDRAHISQELIKFGKIMNQLIADPAKVNLLNSRYGRVRIPDRPFMEGDPLPPGESAVLNLFSLLNFQYCGMEKVDDVTLQLEMVLDATRQMIEYRIPLTPYLCNGKYSFPIRGTSTISSLPLGFSHRGAHSQEFAMDIMELRRIGQGEFSTSKKPGAGEHRVVQTSENVDDYFIYDRGVRAAADGVVVAVENRFPDSMSKNPQENFIKRLNDLTPQLQQKGVSERNIRSGNYIVIDHLNGEFSTYCHLRENIQVKTGEKVKKGQVIAQVGNSGNSSEPHLHFQLMDDKDFATANGLPVVFEDIYLETALDSPFFGERNCLLYSEFIFAFTN
jgi:hypothetical protein